MVLIFTFLFTFIYLPETHGRSVEEIQRMVGTGDDEVWRIGWGISIYCDVTSCSRIGCDSG